MTTWKFEDKPTTEVFTTTKVLKDKEPILFVSHDADDGAWQFHTGEGIGEADAMMVSLKDVVDHDHSVAELADLPLGWSAHRKTKKDDWVKKQDA